MLHSLMAEFLKGTALMILFGVGVHCDEVLAKTKYHGSGHIFAITTWAFGISVTLFIFGGVCINPAMALCQAILGMIPWSSFIPYCIAEFLLVLYLAHSLFMLCMLTILKQVKEKMTRLLLKHFFYKSKL